MPIGDMTGRAANFGEHLLAGPHLGIDLATRWRGMIEQVPLGHVEIAFGNFLTVAIAVRVIEADARQSRLGRRSHAAAILGRLRDELLTPRVGHKGMGVALWARVAGRIMSLQARM